MVHLMLLLVMGCCM